MRSENDMALLMPDSSASTLPPLDSSDRRRDGKTLAIKLLPSSTESCRTKETLRFASIRLVRKKKASQDLGLDIAALDRVLRLPLTRRRGVHPGRGYSSLYTRGAAPQSWADRLRSSAAARQGRTPRSRLG